MIDAFDKITEFCNARTKDVVIRNHAFCIYVNVLQKALANHNNPTRQKTETTCVALLTDEAIEGYVSRAESLVDDMTQAIIEPYEKQRVIRYFWRGVASSVLGSFIFTLLLVLVFWLAREQIHGWLQSLSN